MCHFISLEVTEIVKIIAGNYFIHQLGNWEYVLNGCSFFVFDCIAILFLTLPHLGFGMPNNTTIN